MKCFLSNEEKLLFHRRHWVLFSESLCTELIQYTHDSTMTKHLKRNLTDVLLSQQFFWPEMLQNVCTFCWNCDKCHTNNSWKDCWQSFLKPLPVLKQIWQKIFIDFVVDLSSSKGFMNLLIITDCFSKRIILKLCKNMTAEWVTQTHCTMFLLSSWAFYHNSLRLRHSVCEQFMKESLLTLEDCMKSVHCISLKNWQNNWADELECWAIHSYILQL